MSLHYFSQSPDDRRLENIVEEYVGFPAERPAVYELYWTPSQILARAHPNVLKAQSFLMSHWHSASKSALISTSHPVTYADRLRIRQPGDAGFALGPHMDGGSVERWEENGYGVGGLYNSIFEGNYEAYDPWESSRRLAVVSKLYPGPGGSSVFRMFQGWLSMSTTSAHEGTLLIYPSLSLSTAYLLLRPFFQALSIHPSPPTDPLSLSTYLSPSNWPLEQQQHPEMTPNFPGSVPGSGQELTPTHHPHLSLPQTMTHIPTVRPGDYVAWHPDTIHAVDRVHNGTTDSSVLYIPACPLTEGNATYLAMQREMFDGGLPGPDFPSSSSGHREDGKGEASFLGRLTPDFVMQNLSSEGLRAMGLAPWEGEEFGQQGNGNGNGIAIGLRRKEGERRMLARANQILGF